MKKRLAQTELQKLVQKWAKKLGIDSYKITVHVIDPDDMDEILSGDGITHDYAHVVTSEDKQESDIYINSRFLKDEPEETENTIVHELIHIVLNQLMESVTDTLNSYVSDKNSKDFLCKQLGKLEHKIVVGITRALIEGDK